MIIAVAVGASACPMNLTLAFLSFIIGIHIIAGLGTDWLAYNNVGDRVMWVTMLQYHATNISFALVEIGIELISIWSH